jgi:hypothetical protein
MTRRLIVALLALFVAVVVVSPSAYAEDDDHPDAAPAPAADKPKDDKADDKEPPKSETPGPGQLKPSADGEEDVADDDGTLSKAEEEEGKQAAATHDSAKYAEYIRKIIPIVKERVIDKLSAKITAKTEQKMSRIGIGLVAFSFASWLILLAPLFLSKKYPGKGALLFKFSAIAAASAFLVINLFAGVVFTIKTVQAVAGKEVNPVIKIVVASLDGIEEQAEDLVEFGPQLIQPTLDHITEGEDPMPVPLLENAKKVAKDAQPFINIAKALKGIQWITDYIPIITTLIAVLLFALGAKPVIKELIALPGRAAEGGDPKVIVKNAFQFVGREVVAALGLIAFLIIVTLMSAEAMALAVKPAVKCFLDMFFLNIIFIQTPEFSSGLLYGSLGSVVFFLVLNLAIVIVSSALYLGKTHKIFQARMHDKVPLGKHKKFWLWGTLGLVFVQFFPFLFMLGGEPLVDWMVEKGFAKDNPNWSMGLLYGPLIISIGFLVLLWAARGFKALKFILKYPPSGVEPPPKPAKA